MSSEEKPEIAKLILVGQPETGKTAIYNRLIFNTFYEETISTIKYSNTTKTISLGGGEDVTIDVWDTAGQEKYRSLNRTFYKNATFVLLTFSIIDKASFDELSNYWIKEIKNNCPEYSSKLIKIIVSYCVSWQQSGFISFSGGYRTRTEKTCRKI